MYACIYIHTYIHTYIHISGRGVGFAASGRAEAVRKYPSALCPLPPPRARGGPPASVDMGSSSGPIEYRRLESHQWGYLAVITHAHIRPRQPESSLSKRGKKTCSMNLSTVYNGLQRTIVGPSPRKVGTGQGIAAAIRAFQSSERYLVCVCARAGCCKAMTNRDMACVTVRRVPIQTRCSPAPLEAKQRPNLNQINSRVGMIAGIRKWIRLTPTDLQSRNAGDKYRVRE